MSRVGETGVGEMGIGETGVGEMGVGETGPNPPTLPHGGAWLQMISAL